MKKKIALLAALSMVFSLASCGDKKKTADESKAETTTAAVAEDSSDNPDITIKDDPDPAVEEEYKYQRYASMTPEEIVAEMTLEQKAAQMVQPAIYNLYMSDEEGMKENCYGSVLSNIVYTTYDQWQGYVDGFQQQAIESEAGIPMVYGNDAVHGVNFCYGAVYFPQNIGQGAANDEELAYKVGLITAEETKLCKMLFTFSPVVAQSVDPRWGRTYESYGSDLDTITKLSVAYTKGLVDGGVISCPKHFFADGNVKYGTGEKTEYDCLIDRGDAELTDEEIEKLLAVYQAHIDAGAQTIMISHSSVNGVKMHENKEYIMKLKDEMGFTGFIISDWNSIQNLPEETYEEQVIVSINAGIDMLMEPDRYQEAIQIIVDGVNSGKIPQERVDDAVTRIIKVKKDVGLFDDPMLENMDTKYTEVGSTEYREVAEQLVEESLVLVKNEDDTLPIKEGTKVYITGPAADNAQAQCGGWTVEWMGCPEEHEEGITTLKDAFEEYADDYGIEVITDADQADEADVVLLAVGEQAYAEWYGDTEDMELCGALGLEGNKQAIKEAKELDKPTVTCIMAGRNVILDEEDYSDWDSVVMCYLPGSEGKGMSDVLCGCGEFSGKLPSKWYSSIDEIGTDECRFDIGYGLTYPEDFKPREEPMRSGDNSVKGTDDSSPMSGTAYTKGMFKDNVYTNNYANIKIKIPDGLKQVSENELDMNLKNTISECKNDKDKTRESARIYDYYFEGGSQTMSFEFLNTKQAFPDKPDATEDEYLDDYKEFYNDIIGAFGLNPEYTDRVKVDLGGEEYVREGFVISGFEGDQSVYTYVRRLDDDLMNVIEITWFGDKKTPEDFEKLFEKGESAADNSGSDSDAPMAGTAYSKGTFKDNVYTSEYAGIKAKIPDGLTPMSEIQIKQAVSQRSASCIEDKDKIRESATAFENIFMGDSYFLVFEYLNTKSGYPDNPACTEEDYLDDYTAGLSDLAKAQGVEVTTEIGTKVKLSGKEYTRAICRGGDDAYYYIYARRVDDDLMSIIEVSGLKEPAPEDIEKLFV